MTLLNIGEKVKDLSVEFKSANNHVPWRLISGFRDMAAQSYLNLNMERVWKTVKEDIPEFKEQIKDLLDKV